jgi:hypothetical protein
MEEPAPRARMTPAEHRKIDAVDRIYLEVFPAAPSGG